MSTNEFPGPNDLHSVVNRCPKGFGNGILDGEYIDARGCPASDETSNVAHKVCGRDSLPPEDKWARSKGAQGRNGIRSGLSAMPFM